MNIHFWQNRAGFGLIVATLILGFGLAAMAAQKFVVKFPVKELGNCQSEKECKLFCDKPKNMEICVAFAERNGLMSKEEVKRAKNIGAVEKGPGGCEGQGQCQKYCDDIRHIEECVAYAEEHGIMSPEELTEARRAREAVRKGIKFPGGCKTKNECDNFCNTAEHMEECILFAEKSGLMPEGEREEAQKALAAIKKGAKPPPCRGKKACDAYCDEPEHMEQCMEFAIAAGFIEKEEMGEMQQVLMAIKKGVKPPPCRGREECDEYCAEPEHLEACMTFAVAAGFMSEEDAAMARKTGGKGPGGCRGQEACDAFCAEEKNQETCFEFGLEHGLIPEEDLEMTQMALDEIKEALADMTSEELQCATKALGKERVQKLQDGKGLPNEKSFNAIRGCTEDGQPNGQNEFEGGESGGAMSPESGADDFWQDGGRPGDFEGGFEDEEADLDEGIFEDEPQSLRQLPSLFQRAQAFILGLVEDLWR